MKKTIIKLGLLSLTLSNAFAANINVDSPNFVGVITSNIDSLNTEQMLRNANGSCDATCSITTTFPTGGTVSGEDFLLTQAEINIETQIVSCVVAGFPANYTGSATQSRNFTTQGQNIIPGSYTPWVTTSNNCTAPVVAPITTRSNGNYFACALPRNGNGGGYHSLTGYTCRNDTGAIITRNWYDPGYSLDAAFRRTNLCGGRNFQASNTAPGVPSVSYSGNDIIQRFRCLP